MAHYLGLDLSTQQLKAIVVSSDLTVVSEAKVDFDADFGSQYGITKGVHINQNDNSVYAPVAMWLEALDLVLARLSATTDMAAIKGISGSCQQHGSVYWSLSAEEKLKGLAAGIPIQPLQRIYGPNLDCQIAPFTGDNPATILALPLRPMDAIISLGTSTTFLMSTPYYKPDPAYHFFNHPTTPGQYMFMLCYKNGGLAREKVRDALPSAADKDGDAWASFNSKVTGTSPLHMGNEEDKAKLGLYFYLNEIVPNIRAGTWRFECGPSGDNLTQLPAEKAWDPELDARAIVESQALSMKLRSKNLVHSPANQPSFPPQPRRIYLVGGGSLNPAISKVMGDVLGGLEGVYRLDVGGNACALGGAYKAVWALERAEGETFDELIGKRWKEEAAIEKVSDGYDEKVFAKYEKVLGAFEQMETRLLAEEGR
ncbi:putative D-xylulose kinase A [Ceratocystis platani]|uniref:Putative D-xylulose kinase A n=1 Tax=Ceratocystis fimbriata f. sp. platani TaxID=88771 RepID=A0A0F8DHH0_CERFI|nr:putative D-xylulose kinase A [Ceratocystis platani]